MRPLAFLLVLAASLSAETVRFKTSDGIQIVADFHKGGEDAPTIVCLPMYMRDRATYKPLLRPLKEKGFNVLVLDLRGHGESAPDLKGRAKARDDSLFNAMHLDVEAAFRFLEKEQGLDPTRIGLVGASVGCSVAVDTTVRNPANVRAVVLLTPGSKYLGVPTLTHLKAWPGTRVFTFTSTEEHEKSKAVMDALAPFHGSNHLVLPGQRIHGTMMFGQVPAIEETIANFMEESLMGSVDLRVPAAGLSLTRTVGEQTYTLKLGTKAGKWTLEATAAGFEGKVRIVVDGKRTEAPLVRDQELKKAALVHVEFRPEKGKPVRIPGGKDPFRVYAVPLK